MRPNICGSSVGPSSFNNSSMLSRSSASLFTAAKISSLALLPQGHAMRTERAIRMVQQMDKEGFGNCSNTGACEIECPKNISLEHIARLNREYLAATVTKE